MKQLELKHLAPYLPYNLQVEYKGEITTIDALDFSGDFIVWKNGMVSFTGLKNAKLILRPLSSITEKELEELEDIVGCNFYIYVRGSEWLFSHHFDVFNLIDRGLAIKK